MALQLPNFQRISFSEANPTLTGAQQAMDMITQGIKNYYLPQTLKSEINSKNAYSSLVGPQYMSKLMGHPEILANMPDDQLKQMITYLLTPGQNQTQVQGNMNPYGNQGSIPNPMKSPQQQNNAQQSNQGNPSPYLRTQLQNLSKQDQDGLSNLTPQNNEYVLRGNGQNNPSLSNNSLNQSNNTQPTAVENIANYKSNMAEAEASGKKRGEQIGDLGDVVLNSIGTQKVIDNQTKLLSSPQFEQMRQVPLSGHYELAYYSKYGSPEQQNLVGQYYANNKMLVQQSAKNFKGPFRSTEQTLVMQGTANDSDTVDTARGKTQAIAELNKMQMLRAEKTADIMQSQHINQAKAIVMADKLINADALRQAIHDQLNPTVQIRNNKTNQVMNIPIAEARRRKIKGLPYE